MERSGTFRNFPECSRMFRNVPWNVLERSGTFRNVPWNVPDLSRVGEKALEVIKGETPVLISLISPRYFRTLTSCQIFLGFLSHLYFSLFIIWIFLYILFFSLDYLIATLFGLLLLSPADTLFDLLCGLLHSLLQWIFCLSFGKEYLC